jgi:methionine-rich copper-binding protein CopC
VSRFLPRLAALPAALLLALALAGPAFADAELVASNPSDSAILATPPTAVTLRFNQGVDAGKSSFRLTGPDGEVGTGRPARDGGRVMTLDGLDLGPGQFTVKWVVGSEDGHLVRRTLRFTVLEPTVPPAVPSSAPTDAPASSDPAPTAAPTPTPAPSAEPVASVDPGTDADPAADAGSGTDVLVVIVAALVLVGAMGAWILRRSRGA